MPSSAPPYPLTLPRAHGARGARARRGRTRETRSDHLGELRHDPLTSFEPIGLVAEVPMTLVGRLRLAAADLKRLRGAIAAAQPRLTCAHAGPGSASHLRGLMLVDALMVDLAAVSCPGTAEATADPTAGRLDLLCDQTSNPLAPTLAGRLRMLGVTTQARVAATPNLPTLAEAGRWKLQLAVWHGLYAPKGTPGADIARLSQVLRKRLDGDSAGLAPGLNRAGAPPN